MRILSRNFSTNFYQQLKLSIINNNSTKNVEKIVHIPVMAKEIVDLLAPNDGQYFLDLTFGGGGHTRHLLSTNKKITIFTLDRDHQAFERSMILSKKIEQQNCGQKIIPLLGRFSQLDSLLRNINVPYHSFDGAIIDLGASSFQYEDSSRGFSLIRDGPLDMRMDGDRNPRMPTAADIINTLNAEELTKIFKVYGEEKMAKKIAQTIVDSRFLMKRINTTRELAELIETLIKNKTTHDRLGRKSHPATKIFQALRIFVNNELNELNHVIPVMSRYLKLSNSINDDDEGSTMMITNERYNGGLLAIIAFHSLEDKIIKNHFINQYYNDNSMDIKTSPKSNNYIIDSIHQNNEIKWKKIWKFYRKKFYLPSENEILLNPRSRSAKLRVALRI